MRLAVLSSPDGWHFLDLCRAADSRDQIQCVSFRQLAAAQGPDRQYCISAGPHDLGQFDAVLVRTMPPGTLEQVVFRMDVLGRLEQSGTLVVNPPRAIEAAVDKYLALAKLQAAGLATPKTFVCQSAEQALAGFRELGAQVVVKPLFGGEGRGIMRVEDEALALRVFQTLERLGAVIYLQEFVPHRGFDIRLMVVGDRVVAMRRRNEADWRTNVSRGAATEPLDPDAELASMARAASRAVGAPIAGVDVLPAKDGGMCVLEVNAVPGWRALAPTVGVDVARLVLDCVRKLR